MQDQLKESKDLGLPIAPSLESSLSKSSMQKPRALDLRIILISLFAMGLGVEDSGIAQALTRLIGHFAFELPGFSHQGYPVVDQSGGLVGVLTGCDFSKSARQVQVRQRIKRDPVFISEDQTLRDATDLMTTAGIGRFITVSRSPAPLPKGILTRSNLLASHQARLDETKRAGPKSKANLVS